MKSENEKEIKEIKKIIKEHNLKRNRIKAFLSFILNYMINEKKDKPLKTTIIKVVYLLHSKYNIRFVDFESYLYGPYSDTINSLLYELEKDEVLEINERISNSGSYSYYIFEKAKMPENFKKLLTDEEIKKLTNALSDIYEKFGNARKKLSLKDLLNYIYNKDKYYKNTKFGEPIKFESKG